MNVVLIHPYITSRHPDEKLGEPLGLVCLASYLEHVFGGKVSVHVLDLFALGQGASRPKDGMFVCGLGDRPAIVDQLTALAPDLIGIQCNFTAYANDAFEIAAVAKSACPTIPVVIGGAHVTMEPENVLREHSAIDFVVCGEGELTLEELVRALSEGGPEDCRKIEGLCYRGEDGSVVLNTRRELIPDLNVLPMPDRKYIDMEFYKNINRRLLPFTRKTPAAAIMTSRGCPFDCVFCSTKIMWRRKLRALSAERAVQEIEHLVRDYGVREIAIYDDQFVMDKERVHRICDMLIARRLGISLSIPAGTSIWLVDEALLRKMKQAGFYRLCFPIESGNLNTLKFIRKPIKLDQVKEKIRLASRIGFWTQGNFIIGFPYETREEIAETIRYAYDSGLDYPIFFIAKPYAGSELTGIMKKEGLLRENITYSNIEHSSLDTKTMSARELNEIHDKAVRGLIRHKLFFYLKPGNMITFLVPKVRSWDGISYTLKVLWSGLRVIVLPVLRKA